MFRSVILLIPVLICGILGGTIGYFYRYRLQLRRVLTIVVPLVVFLLLEIMSGTLSSKYTVRENLLGQFDALSPFFFLYLLPAIFASFLVARRYRRWSQ